MPVNRIKLMTPFVGGSFGQRGAVCAEPIAVALALRSKRPVRLVFSREDNFLGLESRTGFKKIDIKMGFTSDGTLTAIKTHMIGTLGGYMGCGPMSSVIGMTLAMGHYRCPNRYGEARDGYDQHAGFGGHAWVRQRRHDVLHRAVDGRCCAQTRR